MKRPRQSGSLLPLQTLLAGKERLIVIVPTFWVRDSFTTFSHEPSAAIYFGMHRCQSMLLNNFCSTFISRLSLSRRVGMTSATLQPRAKEKCGNLGACSLKNINIRNKSGAKYLNEMSSTIGRHPNLLIKFYN